MATITHLMATLTDVATAALKLIADSDANLISIVARSLAVSAMACLLACLVGLLLGAWLGVARFAGRAALLALLNTFLAVPSVVVGLVVVAGVSIALRSHFDGRKAQALAAR